MGATAQKGRAPRQDAAHATHEARKSGAHADLCTDPRHVTWMFTCVYWENHGKTMGKWWFKGGLMMV